MGSESEAPSNPLAGDGATSVERAADAFTDMLAAETDPPRRRERAEAREEPRRKRDEDDRDPGDGDDGQTSDEEADDETDDPLKDEFLDAEPAKDDGDDEKDEADEDDEEGDEDDDEGEDEDPEHEVTVNGKVEKVKQSELIAGYSREADYRQKTQALAKDALEVREYAEKVVEVRKAHDTALQQATDLLNSIIPSQEEMNALKAKDPNAFIQMQEYWSEVLGKVRGLHSERERLAQEEGTATQKGNSTYAAEESRKLIERMPVLADAKKADEFRGRILAYGKRNGYTEEELRKGAVDHRDIITLYKAARYDEIVASRKGNAKPGRKGPKDVASTRPRNIGKGRNRSDGRALSKADRALARSGKVEDAAMAFTGLIQNERI